MFWPIDAFPNHWSMSDIMSIPINFRRIHCAPAPRRYLISTTAVQNSACAEMLLY